MSDLSPQVLAAGPDGVLVRFGLTPAPDAMAAAQVLAAELRADAPDGTVEIAPALVSVLVRFDPARVARADVARDLDARAKKIAAGHPALPDPVRRWTIPAAFGGDHGPQRAEVAQKAGLSESDAVRQICEADLRVLAIGFAPGQPYIGLLPEAWNMPRLSDMTPNVPVGAIVVAVRQIVMFGASSTTGWRQVARTGFRAFVPDRDEPVLLKAGDAIRYVAVGAGEMESLTGDGIGGATLEVLR